MRQPDKRGGETLGAVFSRALVSITVTIINFWGKAKKNRR